MQKKIQIQLHAPSQRLNVENTKTFQHANPPMEKEMKLANNKIFTLSQLSDKSLTMKTAVNLYTKLFEIALARNIKLKCFGFGQQSTIWCQVGTLTKTVTWRGSRQMRTMPSF